MKELRKKITILASGAAFAAALFVTGCDKATAAGFSSPPVGKACTIQFRRDTLGAAGLPVSPMTGNINGAETAISGTLKSTSGEWVVLDCGGKEVWVSKTVILLIKF
jgi:hypothetical protein